MLTIEYISIIFFLIFYSLILVLYGRKSLLFAVIVCVITIVISSVFRNSTSNFFTDVRNISLISTLTGSFIEELVRAATAATLTSIISSKNHISKNVTQSHVVFVAVIYASIEKFKDINGLLHFSSAYLLPENMHINQAVLLAIGSFTSIALHFIIHYLLFSLSFKYALKRMWFYLICTCLYHVFFNLLMSFSLVYFANLESLYINILFKLGGHKHSSFLY